MYLGDVVYKGKNSRHLPLAAPDVCRRATSSASSPPRTSMVPWLAFPILSYSALQWSLSYHLPQWNPSSSFHEATLFQKTTIAPFAHQWPGNNNNFNYFCLKSERIKIEEIRYNLHREKPECHSNPHCSQTLDESRRGAGVPWGKLWWLLREGCRELLERLFALQVYSDPPISEIIRSIVEQNEK